MIDGMKKYSVWIGKQLEGGYKSVKNMRAPNWKFKSLIIWDIFGKSTLKYCLFLKKIRGIPLSHPSITTQYTLHTHTFEHYNTNVS